jgi:hypothetical protein
MGDLLFFPEGHRFTNRDDVLLEAIGQVLLKRNLERGDYDDIIIDAMLEPKHV